MARMKKAAKMAKSKKYRKSPLDSTPWEELSKNIKGRFKSKIQPQEEQKIKNQFLVSEENVNNNNIDILNNQEVNGGKFKKMSSNDFCKTETKKTNTELDSPCELTHMESTQDHENNQNILIKNSFIESSSCKSLTINTKRSLFNPEGIKKFASKKLKQEKKFHDSQISSEKKNSSIQSETKKLSEKKRLERKKSFEKKRLERRKELGIMLLPKNIENRLLRIRKALRKKNLPPEEIKSIMRKERSKAQDEFRKSHSAQMCFNCRKPGHLMANCPTNEENNICIKCGSTEHKYNVCRKKIDGFPFATCFICRGKGHITRNCPSNEHGIYPKGGKCNLCDSNTHLKKDCPTLKNKKKSSVIITTIDNATSIDDEVMDIGPSLKKIKSEEPKVVTF